ncbi:hypothetical protein Tco_0399649 [Tanacetum coccineum]
MRSSAKSTLWPLDVHSVVKVLPPLLFKEKRLRAIEKSYSTRKHNMIGIHTDVPARYANQSPGNILVVFGYRKYYGSVWLQVDHLPAISTFAPLLL